MSQEFYITLPSTTSNQEFTDNQPNAFKARLPQRLTLTGNRWKVALSGVSLPDDTFTLENHLDIEPETMVMRSKWSKVNAKGKYLDRDFVIKMKDLGTHHLDKGEQVMQALIAMTHRRRTEDLRPGDSLIDPETKKRMAPRFRWEQVGSDQELVIDYSNLFIRKLSRVPTIQFELNMALKMGWLTYEPATKTYTLGPNLIAELVDYSMSSDRLFYESLYYRGKPSLWKIVGNYLGLGPRCNWRFRNMNQGYRKIIGAPARSLYIYSNVGASSMVGGQITDLLREVQYVHRNRGTLYFEPIHLQYLPVRSQVVETIEVQIAEADGRLVQFTSHQPSAITLKFKNMV